nr:putative reverse transcriptase domain-containing protein [Tanacetum cinerariifolium]
MEILLEPTSNKLLVGNTNIKQCLRKAADGHFIAAVKVLSSFGVASHCDDTIKALDAKHPYKPTSSMPSITFFEPPLVAEIDSVFSCIKLFPKEFVASAPLTALLKPDNGIRPIAVGTIWRGGAEAILHSVNRVLSEYHNDGSLAMLIVDFSNAFNLVDRSALLHEVSVKCPSISLWVDFLYGKASRLYIGDTHIWSATEVQQCDPLGPILFALILHAFLHKIKDSCKLLLHAWYLDDGTVIEDSEEVARVLDIIKGVKLLGGAVSRDTYFISGLAMRRAANAVDLMGLLPRLHENHILRDSGICGMDDDYVYALACLRDTIPSFDVSGFTNKDTVPSKAQQTLANVFFSEMVKDMEVHFDMTMRQKAVFECLRAPHAQDFLLAIPINGLGQHISPVEYHTIFKYRLMVLLFPVDATCPVCRKACLDSLGNMRRVGISAKKEAPVNFLTDLTDGRSTLRPADVLTALKAASSKVTKHKKACIENKHVFIPFAFDTFGFLTPEAVELLSRVQRVMHSNVMTPKSLYVVFKRIGFAIQKGLAAQLVARLPSTTM